MTTDERGFSGNVSLRDRAFGRPRFRGRARGPIVEPLERRSLLAVRASVTGADLLIEVDSADRFDTAYVRRSNDLIQVAAGPAFADAFSVPMADVARVIVTGAQGRQKLEIVEGVVEAALSVSEVEHVTFRNAATVAGDVGAALTGGELAAADLATTAGRIALAAPRIALAGAFGAVAGIRFDGEVVLGNDVTIAGAAGPVTFGGTVDALRPGGQSLSVTSLGTITFVAPVGARVPLKSLATRANQPLAIPQSEASRSIPLHYLPYTTADGNVQDKYGIEVAIGGGPTRMYEFDTGGNGFLAGYDPAYWPGIDPAGTSFREVYTSGNYYDAVAVDAVVTLGSGESAVSTAVPVQVGAILAGGNSKTGATFDFLGTTPPVEGSFYGDFGASFGINQGHTPGVSITNVLFQLPGSLSNGFVVQLGPIGGASQFTVGLTPELRAQFPYAVPLSEIAGLFYPTSGRQAYEIFGFDAAYTLSSGDRSVPLGAMQSLIDSGAPSMGLRLPSWPSGEPYPFSSGGDSVDPGTTMTVTFPAAPGTDPLVWSFVAGNDGSVNQISYGASSGTATTGDNVNMGLNVYNAFDVMFDVEAGLVRLRPNGGSATVVLNSVRTAGPQTYGQNVVLAGEFRTGGGRFEVAGATTLLGDAWIEGGHGAVTFTGSVEGTTDGGEALTVVSRSSAKFVRPIGPTVPLASVTTRGGGATSVAGATTKGDQSFGGLTTLAGTFESRHGGFRVAGAARLAGAVWVTTGGPPIDFDGAIDGAFPLVLDAGGASAGAIRFGGPVGRHAPLAGVAIESASIVRGRGAVYLDGAPAVSLANGLAVADGASVTFARGGSIRGFVGSGVVFAGDSARSTLAHFTIRENVGHGIALAGGDYAGTGIGGNRILANAGFGIQIAAAAKGLRVVRNTIGDRGTANPWGLVSGGPNTHGIVLAPGDYAGSVIASNRLRFNARSGLMAPDGVKGLLVRGNTLADNGFYGVELVTGDFTGTVFAANVIRRNGLRNVFLGEAAGPPVAGGDPLAGYEADTGRYFVPYTEPADFTGADSFDPQIALRIGTREHAVNLDTGSRGLYLDALQLDPGIVLDGPSGYVYLNSSNRLYFGTWSTQQVTFVDSSFTPAGSHVSQDQQAVATVPVLVVTAIGASLTPPPGSTVASTTFGTTVPTGNVVITDGIRTAQVPIVPIPEATPNGPQGNVTIPGGWWANYADNMLGGASILSPVANFGVGFDRSGLGTFPTTDGLNQSYNAFLNIAEMRSGTMRAGYVISPQGVTLGLDSAQSGFAYTRLAPTGLSQGASSPPDWQPATGTLTLDGTAYPTGQVVIDMGIPSGILTLPGRSPGESFKGTMQVDLLNSGGAVSYVVDTLPQTTTMDPANLLNPSTVASFAPLAGAYSLNAPPFSQQFFNTGRSPFAAFEYLYDATGGYLGLKVVDHQVLQTARGKFTADYFVNPNLPKGVTNVTIR